MGNPISEVEIQAVVLAIQQARDLIRKAKETIGIPQIERCLYNADIELHWACWNLGYVEEIVPDCE